MKSVGLIVAGFAFMDLAAYLAFGHVFPSIFQNFWSGIALLASAILFTLSGTFEDDGKPKTKTRWHFPRQSIR